MLIIHGLVLALAARRPHCAHPPPSPSWRLNALPRRATRVPVRVLCVFVEQMARARKERAARAAGLRLEDLGSGGSSEEDEGKDEDEDEGGEGEEEGGGGLASAKAALVSASSRQSSRRKRRDKGRSRAGTPTGGAATEAALGSPAAAEAALAKMRAHGVGVSELSMDGAALSRLLRTWPGVLSRRGPLTKQGLDVVFVRVKGGKSGGKAIGYTQFLRALQECVDPPHAAPCGGCDQSPLCLPRSPLLPGCRPRIADIRFEKTQQFRLMEGQEARLLRLLDEGLLRAKFARPLAESLNERADQRLVWAACLVQARFRGLRSRRTAWMLRQGLQEARRLRRRESAALTLQSAFRGRRARLATQRRAAKMFRRCAASHPRNEGRWPRLPSPNAG